ncbi:MAG TPA: lysylphosphatidylglycerol synthase domain-containing protein, partial [Myxococcota bacterium]|nr:lysylphosphatidylglycerol synthase domain-containing protein [Myxococcota bacterium]
MMPTDPSIDTRRPGTGFRAPVWAWIGGLIALFVLVAVVRHLGEERRFAELVEQAKPGWLGVAAALQLATYVCAGGVWYSALRGEPSRPSLARLVPLGLAKLFTDQAVPSSGLSGTLLVVRGLIRLGVPGGRAAI